MKGRSAAEVRPVILNRLNIRASNETAKVFALIREFAPADVCSEVVGYSGSRTGYWLTGE